MCPVKFGKWQRNIYCCNCCIDIDISEIAVCIGELERHLQKPGGSLKKCGSLQDDVGCMIAFNNCMLGIALDQ